MEGTYHTENNSYGTMKRDAHQIMIDRVEFPARRVGALHALEAAIDTCERLQESLRGHDGYVFVQHLSSWSIHHTLVRVGSGHRLVGADNNFPDLNHLAMPTPRAIIIAGIYTHRTKFLWTRKLAIRMCSRDRIGPRFQSYLKPAQNGTGMPF